MALLNDHDYEGVAAVRHPQRATGKRIVVADDEAMIRMGIRCILEDAGHTVVGEASSGSEVLSLVHELRPDLVLLDIRMPPPDGIEVARRLMTDHPVPVIFVTALDDRMLMADAAQAGGYAYIVKPVREGEVLAAVELAAARWRESHGATDASETRTLVDRAKGILMRRLGLSADDADYLLHQRSRALHRSLREVARDVLRADETFRPPKPPP